MPDNVVAIIIKVTDEFSKTVGEAGKKFENLGKQLNDMGNKLTLGVTVPIMAAGAASIKMASDLNDAMGKTETVFGENAGAVETWAGGLATSFGLSKTKALEYAGTLGSMFQNMGIASDKSTEMSQGLTQLASDYAAFANVPIDQAFSMLQSGLAGRGMELKKFGIDVSDAVTKQKALQMGLAATADELTESDMVMARYSIMAQGMSRINGEWANSTGDLDIQMQNMKASTENAAAALGQNLLPLQLQLTNAANSLLTAFNNLSPGMQKVVLGFAGLAAAIGPAMKAIALFQSLLGLFSAGGALAGAGTAISGAFAGIGTAIAGAGAAIGAAILPIIVVIGALAAAVALLYVGWKNNWFGIQDTLRVVTEGLKGTFQAFLQVLQGDWQGAGETLKAAWSSTWDLIQQRFEAVKTTFSNIAKTVGNFITTGLIEGVKSAATKLVEAVKGVVQSALDAAKKLLGISSPSSVFAAIGQNMMQGMALGIQSGTSMPVASLKNATIRMAGATTTNINIPMTNTINNGIDVEALAYRVAEVIQRRQRRR